MIRILVDGCIFSAYPHGGIARIFRETWPRIVKNNEDIEFYVLCDEKGRQHIPIGRRIRPLSFAGLNLRPAKIFRHLDVWRHRNFNRAIIELSPDIFQSTYYTMPPFTGMKTIATVYDLVDHQFPLMQPNGPGFVERQGKVLKSADRVVSISRSTADLAIKVFGLDPGRVETIGLGASDRFIPATEDAKRQFRAKLTNGRPYFLFVGAAGGYKNLATLIRAFSEIAEYTGHVLLLAGHSMNGIEPWLIDLAIQSRVEERIITLHRPTDEVLSTAYSAATAFVFPSLQEGFGIPLLEAMKCECRVIASDIPVFREICQDAAIYFDPHSPTQLAQGLLKATTKYEESQAGCSTPWPVDRYSWDLAAKRIESIYRELAPRAA